MKRKRLRSLDDGVWASPLRYIISIYNSYSFLSIAIIFLPRVEMSTMMIKLKIEHNQRENGTVALKIKCVIPLFFSLFTSCICSIQLLLFKLRKFLLQGLLAVTSGCCVDDYCCTRQCGSGPIVGTCCPSFKQYLKLHCSSQKKIKIIYLFFYFKLIYF
jgi:hypothetical protein